MYGPGWGYEQERRRVLRGLRGKFKCVLALQRFQQRGLDDEGGIVERDFDLEAVRNRVAKFDRARTRAATKKQRSFKDASRIHSNAFPLLVQSKQANSGEWVESIFYGLDKGGCPRVATGEGADLCCESYQLARIAFKDSRSLVVNGSLA